MPEETSMGIMLSMKHSGTPGLTSLMNRLKAAGLSEKYVREYGLPEWWDDEVANTPLGFTQAVGYISGTLGLDPRCLMEPNAEVRFKKCSVQWKTPRNASREDLVVVQGIATQAAEIALSVAPEPKRSIPPKAAEWRTRLLERAGRVSFEALLNECWACGIVVLSITGDALPTKKNNRPHGLAAHLDGKFAIVLMGRTQDKVTAWQLFRLAHEVAHIALGHLTAEGVVVDVDIFGNEQNTQEKEANDFATELLFGQSTAFRTKQGKRWLSAEQLLQAALSQGDAYRVEPGAIILNWARHETQGDPEQRCWATAQAALSRLAKSDAHELTRQQTKKWLDWADLSEAKSEFLRRVTGLPEPHTHSTTEIETSHALPGKHGVSLTK